MEWVLQPNDFLFLMNLEDIGNVWMICGSSVERVVGTGHSGWMTRDLPESPSP